MMSFSSRPSAGRTLPLAAVAAAFGVAVALMVSSPVARAAAPSKDECVEAHSKGQDFRDKGQLADARAQFLTCAQPVCPALVQSDCARFAEDAGRLVPSVTFAARTWKGVDLPETSVSVDDKIVASRLDEGKAFELNPGKHSVRFSHDGKDVILQVVVSQGERGRSLVATFGDGAASSPGGSGDAPSAPAGVTPGRSAVPLVVAGAGVALAVTGAVLFVVGSGKVPDNCSLSSRECAAPAGDASFDKARSGVTLMNVGGIVGGAGVVALGSGLIWYFTQSTDSAPRTGSVLAPWLAPGAGGVSFSGRL
jgi:hypothetical protein